MKILIIGVPRSGTTSFLNCFKNYKLFDEPLNSFSKQGNTIKSFYNLIKKKNIVVKTMSDHTPIDWKGDKLLFNFSIIPHFDRVILLDRKNIKEQEKSYHRVLDLALKTVEGFTEKTHKNAIKSLYLQKYLLREIADKFNLDINYYEDIYYGDSKYLFENLKIDLNEIDFNLLDSKNKYTENVHYQPPKPLI